MESALATFTCFLLVLLGACALVLSSAVRIVPEHQRMVLFRLGRALDSAKGPGLVIVMPIIDRPVLVDVREVQENSRQDVTTAEGIPVSMELALSLQVADPVQSIVGIQDWRSESHKVAVKALQAIAHDIPARNVVAERERIVAELHSRLSDAVGKWGIRVMGVEIRDLTVPPQVQGAASLPMNLIGSRGQVSQSLMPTGRVLIEFEAVSDELLMVGDSVVVKGIEKEENRLRVARA